MATSMHVYACVWMTIHGHVYACVSVRIDDDPWPIMAQTTEYACSPCMPICAHKHVHTQTSMHIARMHTARMHTARMHTARMHIARMHIARIHIARLFQSCKVKSPKLVDPILVPALLNVMSTLPNADLIASNKPRTCRVGSLGAFVQVSLPHCSPFQPVSAKLKALQIGIRLGSDRDQTGIRLGSPVPSDLHIRLSISGRLLLISQICRMAQNVHATTATTAIRRLARSRSLLEQCHPTTHQHKRSFGAGSHPSTIYHKWDSSQQSANNQHFVCARIIHATRRVCGSRWPDGCGSRWPHSPQA